LAEEYLHRPDPFDDTALSSGPAGRLLHSGCQTEGQEKLAETPIGDGKTPALQGIAPDFGPSARNSYVRAETRAGARRGRWRSSLPRRIRSVRWFASPRSRAGVFHHQVDVDVADALALLGDDRDFQTVGIGDVRGLTEIRRDDMNGLTYSAANRSRLVRRSSCCCDHVQTAHSPIATEMSHCMGSSL
jgi:hypothetical protein